MFSDPIQLGLGLFVVAVALAFIARRDRRRRTRSCFVLGGSSSGSARRPGDHARSGPRLLAAAPADPVRGGYFDPDPRLQSELRPIRLLAIGLVLFTAVVVALVMQALVPAMTWPVALTLGAIVAPPDAVAATAVFQRLGVPRRIVTILEGESLVNDASALIIYGIAVMAVAVGSALLAGRRGAVRLRRASAGSPSASSSA